MKSISCDVRPQWAVRDDTTGKTCQSSAHNYLSSIFNVSSRRTHLLIIVPAGVCVRRIRSSARHEWSMCTKIWIEIQTFCLVRLLLPAETDWTQTVRPKKQKRFSHFQFHYTCVTSQPLLSDVFKVLIFLLRSGLFMCGKGSFVRFFFVQ